MSDDKPVHLDIGQDVNGDMNVAGRDVIIQSDSGKRSGVVAAIISAIAVVIAAIIIGLFTLFAASGRTGTADTSLPPATETTIAETSEITEMVVVPQETDTPVPPTPTPAPSTPTTPPPPVGAFTSDTTGGMAPLAVQFAGSQSTGVISNYSWDFGDGGTSNEVDPLYTFNRSGIYRVRLTVDGPGGQDEAEMPIVVAPHTSTPLGWQVWLTDEDLDRFGGYTSNWSNSFPDGSEIYFRPFENTVLMDYLRGDLPLAAGEPDVLYLSWGTHQQLLEMFYMGYSLYDPASGNQPPDRWISPPEQLRSLIDEYQVSYEIDSSTFATQDDVVYGIPFMDGFLIPIGTERMGYSNEQAFVFAMWLYLNQPQ